MHAQCLESECLGRSTLMSCRDSQGVTRTRQTAAVWMAVSSGRGKCDYKSRATRRRQLTLPYSRKVCDTGVGRLFSALRISLTACQSATGVHTHMSAHSIAICQCVGGDWANEQRLSIAISAIRVHKKRPQCAGHSRLAVRLGCKVVVCKHSKLHTLFSVH
jgi:hypothetical protein